MTEEIAAYAVVRIVDQRVLYLRAPGENTAKPALFASYSDVENYLSLGLVSQEGTPMTFEFWEAKGLSYDEALRVQENVMELAK